ncbi:MAG: hypothetical protein ACOC7J_02905, partial [Armatimonadota bacterium]
MSSGLRKSCVMVVLLLAIVPGRCDVMDTVSQWSVWEGELAGEVAHASLPSDVTVSVRLTAPSGQDHR